MPEPHCSYALRRYPGPHPLALARTTHAFILGPSGFRRSPKCAERQANHVQHHDYPLVQVQTH